MISKILGAAAAIALAASPAMAAPVANPAASLSVAKSIRAGTVSTGKDRLAGGGFVIAIIAVVAVIAGIIIVADNDDSDSN